MGIKDLWHILGPFCDRKPLYELQGKTVAIDLSCWICEAQNISDYQVQPRMYLRNLYFRTCCLLLLEVNPVFVLDGRAPTLKYKTIAARNAIQFRGAKPKSDPNTKKCKDRSRFNYTLKQCEEMLQLMGIACIKGNGEAEALCAHLNEDGLVHGCITQDSDCFAYGAKTVFRNFSISQQGVHAGSGGSIDVYDIDKLKESNGIGRNKIIALALLCGSDYNDGVFGVGKDSVIKLFNEVSEQAILDRLRSWRTMDLHYADLEKKLSNKTICTNCGHPGRLQSHNKSGCKDCGKSKGCDESDYKQKQQIIKNEVSIRKKALEDPDFPSEELIQEFQKRKDNVHTLNLRWQQPNMTKFIYFCCNYLQWDEIYTLQKFLPILTRWHLLNVGKSHKDEQYPLVPDCIKKVRNPKGIPSYEIIWLDKNDAFKDLIPEEQLADVDLIKLFSTIEPQSIVGKAYPDLVAKFDELKSKPKKQPKRKKKEDDGKPKRERKQKTTAVPRESQKTIDSYYKKALINNIKGSNLLENSKKTEDIFDFDLDISNFGDENDSDLSDIVEDIVSRKPDYVKKHLEGIKAKDDLDNSSFFIMEHTEEDMFEKTFNELCRNESDESKSEEEIVETEIKTNEETDESFTISYIPLADRIKQKL